MCSHVGGAMEHGGHGRADSDGNSIRINEEIEKEPVKGCGLDSGTGNEISATSMEVDLDVMEQQLQALVDAGGVEHTPEMQAGSESAPQTAEKVEIPQFAEVVTGPCSVTRGRGDQVSGLTATKAAAMRTECKRVQAVSYQVRAETADGLQALREKIKTSGGALWEEGIFMEWGCVTPTHRSGRQTGVHQTCFLRSETLPASLSGGDGEECRGHDNTLERVRRLDEDGGGGASAW